MELVSGGDKVMRWWVFSDLILPCEWLDVEEEEERIYPFFHQLSTCQFVYIFVYLISWGRIEGKVLTSLHHLSIYPSIHLINYFVSETRLFTRVLSLYSDTVWTQPFCSTRCIIRPCIPVIASLTYSWTVDPWTSEKIPLFELLFHIHWSEFWTRFHYTLVSFLFYFFFYLARLNVVAEVSFFSLSFTLSLAHIHPKFFFMIQIFVLCLWKIFWLYL